MLNSAFIDELFADPDMRAALSEDEERPNPTPAPAPSPAPFTGPIDPNILYRPPVPESPAMSAGGDVPGMADIPQYRPNVAAPPTLQRGGQPLPPPDLATAQPYQPLFKPGELPPGMMPTPSNMVIDEHMTPRKGPGWRGVLGKVLGGAITAAATPNIAGGGPVDIFRSMQASQGAQQQKDMLAYNMARQRMMDRTYMDEHNARMQDYLAQAEQRRKMGDAKERISIEQALEQEYAAAKTPEEKQAVLDKLALVKHGTPKPTAPPKPDFAEEAKRKLASFRLFYGIDPSVPDAEAFKQLPPEVQQALTGARAEKVFAPERESTDYILLHPDEFSPAQVAQAKSMFAQAHYHPPHEKTAAEERREAQSAARTQASKIWLGTEQWLKQNGKPVDVQTILDLSRSNLQQYFPEMENFGDVDAEIQKIGRTGGLTKKSLDSTQKSGFNPTPQAGQGSTSPAPAPANNGGGRGGHPANPNGAAPKPAPKVISSQQMMDTYNTFKEKRGWKTPDDAKRYLQGIGYTVN